jgi:hypothetical protein
MDINNMPASFRIGKYRFSVLYVLVFFIYMIWVMLHYVVDYDYVFTLNPKYDLINPKVIICPNDCNDYHVFSDYLLANRKFIPSSPGGDLHASTFYRGFVLWIAILKGVFGQFWQVVYVLCNGLITYFLALFFAKSFSRYDNEKFVFLAAIFLFAFNMDFSFLSKTLLADYIFSIGAGFAFILLGIGGGQKKGNYLIGAICIITILVFIRGNGIYLAILSLGVLLSYWIPEKWRLQFVWTTPVLGGVIIMIFFAGFTAYSVKNLENNPFLEYGFLHDVFEIETKVNYLGDERLTHDNRLGLYVGGQVHKNWYLHNGTFGDTLIGFLHRIPSVFEIAIPNSRYRNLFRYAYYLPIYFLCLVYLIYAIRSRKEKPEHLLMLSLFCGYLLIFVSITHIENRYILPFRTIMVLGSAFALDRILKHILSTRAYSGRIEEQSAECNK